MEYINQSLQNIFGAKDDYSIDKMLNWEQEEIIEEDYDINNDLLEDNKVEITHNNFKLSLKVNNINMTATKNDAIPIVNRY
jgi:hypothetical protein